MNKIAKEILEKLEENGYIAYIVGGYVRDFLLYKETNDIDICTNATTKEVRSLFSGNANEYGSLNLKINEFNIDITTFREEHNYKNRKPTSISYATNLKTDLYRRDFTINTLCMDKDEKIIDELNGINDLNNKIIRMVGDVKLKILEDPLRILRAIRFATTLDFSIDATLKEEIIKNKELLSTLSDYRIKEEISKILISPNYKKGLKLLKEYHLCEALGITYTNVIYTKDLCGMWAQIETKRKLPFTKSEKDNIVKIRKILDLKMINREVLYEYGLYLSLIASEILGIDPDSIHEMHASLPIYTRKDLNVTFNEICAILGVIPSKRVKDVESALIREVIHGHIENEKEVLKGYLLSQKTRWFN